MCKTNAIYLSYTTMPQQIIFFDGVCNLCNGFVQFVVKRDKGKKFAFAALQTPNAIETLKQYNLNPLDLQSVVLLANQKIYLKSDAALEIVKQLSGFWFLVGYFKFLPQTFRNWVYDFIAKNRYKWFGKTNSCQLPEVL